MEKELTPFQAKKAQKFHALDLVCVDVKSEQRSHFKTGFHGIVAYSYMDKYGGTNNKSFSIIHLNKKLTKAVSQSAWYNVEDLIISYKLTKEQIEKILEDLTWIDL